MPGQAVIDTVVGLAFVFFLVSIAGSTIVEWVANLFTKRAKYLLRGLRELLEPASRTDTAKAARFTPSRGDAKKEKDEYEAALTSTPRTVKVATAPSPGSGAPDPMPITVVSVMGHPLVQPFKQARPTGAKTRNPSYLSARTFASVVLSFLVPDASGKTAFDDVRGSIAKIDNVPLRDALAALATTAEGDVTKFREAVEHWYDAQMDRVAGAYKRWAKRWLIVVTLVVAGFLHVDAIGVGEALWTKEPVREAVISAATNNTLCSTSDPVDKRRQCLQQELASVQTDGLPVGLSYWTDASKRPQGSGWLTTVLGILVTTAAASLGAPFWFDVISRVAPLRNTGNKPAPTPLRGSSG